MARRESGIGCWKHVLELGAGSVFWKQVSESELETGFGIGYWKVLFCNQVSEPELELGLGTGYWKVLFWNQVSELGLGTGYWKCVLESDFETIFRTIFLKKVLQKDFLISF